MKHHPSQPTLWPDVDAPTAVARTRRKDPGHDDQRRAILRRLRRGPATSAQLSRYALKYTGRISELRQLGHAIRCDRLGNGLYRYTLLEP